MALRVRELSDDERHELERRARSRTEAVRVVERAHLILAVAAGQTAPAAAVALGLAPDTGRAWVKRFNAAGLDGLEDRPRSGRPVTYGPELVGEVLATALTKPDALGLPFACWTLDRLEAYLNEERGIAIKRSRIDELLVDEGLRWRTQETWFGERAAPPGGEADPSGGVSSGPPPGRPTQTEQERARRDPQFAQNRGPASPSTPPRRRGVSSAGWTSWGRRAPRASPASTLSQRGTGRPGAPAGRHRRSTTAAVAKATSSAPSSPGRGKRSPRPPRAGVPPTGPTS